MSESSGATAVMDAPLAHDIRSTAVCLSVEFAMLGNSKRGNLALVETDAEKTSLGLTKKLLTSPELDALHNVRTSIRHALHAQALHSHLRPGLWLIPLAKIETIDQMMLGYDVLWQAAVDTLIAAYPARCKEAPERLKSQYDAGNYLNTETEGWEASIRAKCRLSWSYVDMETPTRLRSISRAIWEREQQKAADDWETARQAAQQVLRLEMAGMLAELHGKMTEDNKRLQKRYLERCHAWIDGFRDGKYAITQDHELQALITEWERLLSANDIQALRSDEALRAEVATQIQTIRTQLDTMLETAPSRRYALTIDANLEEAIHGTDTDE